MGIVREICSTESQENTPLFIRKTFFIQITTNN